MACDICGRKATTDDGMVGAYLCDDPACLDVAWDAAQWPATAPQSDEQDHAGPDHRGGDERAGEGL